MNRNEILEAAEKCTEDNFKLIAELWMQYLRASGVIASEEKFYIRPQDVAAMLALLKIARIATGNVCKADNWVDLAGYAACGGEIESGYSVKAAEKSEMTFEEMKAKHDRMFEHVTDYD